MQTAEILPVMWILMLDVLNQVKSIIKFFGHINFCIKHSGKTLYLQYKLSAVLQWSDSFYYFSMQGDCEFVDSIQLSIVANQTHTDWCLCLAHL